MSSAQKLSFQVALGQIARNGAEKSIGLLGKGLPASIVSVNGGIAKIKFEVLSDYNMPQIEVPIAGSEYARAPLKAGDKGIVLSCDTSIAGVCGLSTDTSDLSAAPNLSALTFFPIGNKNWQSVDPDMYVITGRSDVMLRDNSHQLQLEDENTSWNSLISQLNTILDDITAKVNAAALTTTGLTPPANFAHITANTNPVKARA
jgi:hypothetical protein